MMNIQTKVKLLYLKIITDEILRKYYDNEEIEYIKLFIKQEDWKYIRVLHGYVSFYSERYIKENNIFVLKIRFMKFRLERIKMFIQGRLLILELLGWRQLLKHF